MESRGGSIKSTSINGVKLYSISGNRNPAAWLAPKKLKALRKDKDYRERVDIIQDLRFETATTRIKVTPDGEYVIASGIYPPQVKVYELKQLSLKFERHLVSEIINFEVLADDYSKIAFLCADRSVCLHAKHGSHYNLRIPRMGRDMAYDCWSCDLLCAASAPELYRINLEQEKKIYPQCYASLVAEHGVDSHLPTLEIIFIPKILLYASTKLRISLVKRRNDGRFLSSLSTQSPAINVVTRSKIHGLVASGGDDGAVECFDTRTKSSVGRINALEFGGDAGREVTALQFDESHGYRMAVGSSTGKIAIYDLRMSDPVRVKDHMYGSPILNIKWHQTLNSVEAKVISTDRHVVRVWDPNTGDNMTSIEPSGGPINDVCIFRDSGLMLLALDCSQIPSYFIPALGPAPKWCSHLDNLTEELEEGSQSVIYDDYKFLTKQDLERLNLTSLIGTNLLRAYMHGFFVDYRLYQKAQAAADPFAYDAYIEKKKQEKIEAERASRITIKRKLPKVNRLLAARLFENEATEEVRIDDDTNPRKKLSKKDKRLTSEILKDERFSAMFENEDFQIDEQSAEYLALHPQNSRRHPSLVEEHFEPIMEDYEELDDSDASVASQLSEEDTDNVAKKLKSSKHPRLYEVKDQRHAEAFLNSVSLAEEDALPLGERVARSTAGASRNEVKLGPGGSREISFVSRSFKRYGNEEPREDKRRGVQSLGLKQDKSEFYSSRGGRGGRGSGGRGRGGGGGGRGSGGRGSGGGRGSRGRGRR